MKWIDRLLWRVVDTVIAVSVLGMVMLIALQVGSRLAGASIAWTEELSRLLFIWTIWLGLGTGFRHGAHPSLSVLTSLLPPRAAVALKLLPPLAAMILFALVAWHGTELLHQQLRFGEQSAILQVGMWLFTLPLVLGAGLSMLGAALHTIEAICSEKGNDPIEQPPAGGASNSAAETATPVMEGH
ncbi:TRAP transporter small permease (plasmid) [Limimaricola variabilis]|uniref:TRAP transporter small permease n=1 Tax=Limimaricola variabilis TaxID=1492771 RepID=UPI002AC96AA6|nr:TRAP transporter small permease [Limimaricola variabilis]WPY96541.1 TRAP transporter small permease [Limimaricola variabilis]